MSAIIFFSLLDNFILQIKNIKNKNIFNKGELQIIKDYDPSLSLKEKVLMVSSLTGSIHAKLIKDIEVTPPFVYETQEKMHRMMYVEAELELSKSQKAGTKSDIDNLLILEKYEDVEKELLELGVLEGGGTS